MASNHSASSASFNDPISMLDASDTRSATQLRTIFEKLHDNTAYLRDRAVPATQAQQEAATDVVQPVTPGRQHFHPSAAKFWSYATVSAGTPTLQASYNVTSITDSANGVLIVNLATAFSSANWAAVAMARFAGARYTCITGQSASSVTIAAFDPATDTTNDPTAWSVVGYGDQ